MTKSRLLSIGIPVLDEEANIPELRTRLESTLEKVYRMGLNVEILINNNNSQDQSRVVLDEWAKQDSRVKVNHFLKTVSFQESIILLMRQSKGDAFALLQSDLQDPPEILLDFIKGWNSGQKIVVGVITKRAESFFSNFSRKLFYGILVKFSDGKIVPGLQDFYLLDKEIVDHLKKLSPEGLFLRGHISTRFGKLLQIPYVRASRERGTSNFNFASKYSLALDGLLLFGTRFIRTISTISFLLFCVGVLGSLGIIASYLFGFRAPLYGWASLGVLLLTILSLIGIVTGLILEYLIRIYRFQVFNSSND